MKNTAKAAVFFAISVFIFPLFARGAEYSLRKTVYSYWAQQPNLAEGIIILPGPDLSARYERKIDKGSSWCVEGKINFHYTDDYSALGIGAEAGYMFYMQGHALNGFFAGPRAGASFSMASAGDETESCTVFSFGAEAGYRWMFEEGLSVSPKVTAGFALGAADVAGVNVDLSGFNAGVGCGVGYAWN